MKNQHGSQFALFLLIALAVAPVVAFAAESLPAPPDVASPPSDATVTDTGLATKVLQPGTGTDHPMAQDLVEVHYTGWTTDGEMFDSSVAKGKPVGLPLANVIAGWQEGMMLMVTGEKRRMWIPEELAYAGREGRPQGMLVFDVELRKFERRTPDPVPADVAGPPPEAETGKGGLAWVVLRPGTGTDSPKSSDNVNVHYTGWTTDGEMFDSSHPRGRPINFKLNAVIKGWTEGVKMMVKGEKRRFWIPEKLAYKGKREPKGMLVFDIELVSFY